MFCLQSCLSQDLPLVSRVNNDEISYNDIFQIIQSSSPMMGRLALRALHTYASGGEIVGLDLGLTGIVFGMNAHGREVVEGRAVMQVGEDERKFCNTYFKDFWHTTERDFFQDLFNLKAKVWKISFYFDFINLSSRDFNQDWLYRII